MNDDVEAAVALDAADMSDEADLGDGGKSKDYSDPGTGN